jgi:hypothetical protein
MGGVRNSSSKETMEIARHSDFPTADQARKPKFPFKVVFKKREACSTSHNMI